LFLQKTRLRLFESPAPTRSQTDHAKKYTTATPAKSRSNSTTAPRKYQVTIAAVRDVCGKLKEADLLCETDDNYVRRWPTPAGAFNNLSTINKKTAAVHVVKLKAATGSSLSRPELLRAYAELINSATLTKETARETKRKRKTSRSDLDEEDDEDEAAPAPTAAPSVQHPPA
jgi:hypothetical protein